MSDVHRCLDEVSRLLAAVEGVVVLDRRVEHARVVLDIDIRDDAVAHRLQCLCEAANVELDPPMRITSPPRFQVGSARHFSIRARYQPFDTIEFGYLQLLGIHLIWRLHRLGALAPDEANPLLRRWNAAPVGV